MPSVSGSGDPRSASSKVCTRCGIEKPLTEFYINKSKRTLYESRCKPCFVAAQSRRKPGLPYRPHPHSGLRHPERFWAKVTKTPACWLWTGAHNHLGYGSYRWQGRGYLAHRLAYMLVKGDIPNGLDLDHLCRNPSCVNPDHLEPVSRAENTARGYCAFLKRTATHCKRGHAFSAENIYYDRQGHRHCRACMKDYGRRRYLRTKSLWLRGA